MRLNKRISRINNPRSLRGSIVLEASLVMPAFVMVIFLFIYMVQMTLISLQMQNVAAGAVRQVSAHIYPVALAVSGQVENAQEDGGQVSGKESTNGSDGKDNSPFVWSMPELSMQAWAGKYASALPSPLSEWVQSAAERGDEPLADIKNSVSESLLDPVVKPLLKPFMQGTWLKDERLHVSRVTVPDIKTGKNPYFGLEISYELPIKVPFTGNAIVLQARAEERLWIGDTGELNEDTGGTGNGEGAEGEPAVVLAKPDPAYAGHRATIKAKVSPGTKATLTVYYKSGVSQAKYLGEATADENGIIEWKWLVGGRTTPGTWTFVIETETGLKTTEQFTVESPGGS
ncbi:TadE family protein [Paenibacillus sp. M1]|uniref:TadE family protein n=1 Tax=Paenibacillus haidiansis TaxID=1574488 RepID=A0ABU7VTP9_9BACL